MVAESFFQFVVFQFDHESAGEDCEGGEEPADGEGAGEAPGEEFAEVGQIYGMAHAGADAGGDELLIVSVEQFGKSAELRKGEVGSGEAVEGYSGEEQECGWDEGSVVVVEREVTPGEGDGGEDDPHCDPDGEKDFVG